MQVLGPVDSAFYYLDSSETPMNIGSIMIFAGEIDFDLLVKLVDSRIHQAPIYQQKVVHTPLNLGEPTWIYDTEFYIENHIFRRTLDAPGTEEQLRAVAGEIIARRLRRDKPLWELHVIYGLAGKRTAVLMKMHHCMVDGMSAVDLFMLMLDASPELPVIERKPQYDPPREPDAIHMLAHNARVGIPHRVNLMKRLGGEAMQLGLNLLDRKQRKKTLVGITSLVSDAITPIEPLSINGKNAGKLSLRWVELPLEDVLAIRKKHEVSVNDVMLTLLGTAVGRYEREMNPENTQDFMRVIVPVNMRSSEDNPEDEGNRISVLLIEVPFEALDSVDRLKKVAEYSRVMKGSELAKTFDIALTLPAFAHPVAQPWIWGIAPQLFSKTAHTWCTNVAGPQMELYLLGCELQHVYGYLPVNPTMGIANTILSYGNWISLNILADTGIVSDADRLGRYVLEAYYDLCAASDIEATLDQVPPSDEPLEGEDLPLIEETPYQANGHQPAGIEVRIHQEQHTRLETRYESHTETDVTVKSPLRLMSQAWADALYEEINQSDSYYQASTRWTAGAVAMVMLPAPEHGYPTAEAVLLDLYRGKCRVARNVPLETARQQAAFVLEGSYDNWMAIIEKRAQAIPMIVSGKIKLAKGSLRKLMPYTRSSQELVKCAIRITHN
jgi:WS/DGAT/MGAT family acyltransferase